MLGLDVEENMVAYMNARATREGLAQVEARLVPQGDPRGDWDIRGPEHHGIDGVVNLFGIESPGLTSSLAIAGYVAGLLEKSG